MRRLVLLTAGILVILAAIAAIAYAVTDTVSYTVGGSHKGKPSKAHPAYFTYTSTLNVDTNPPGLQPDVAPRADVFFDKGIKTNGALFPFCNQAEIDGTQTLPAKCKKAVVGTGTAKAYAGTPGTAPTITENLTVTIVNGPKGKKLWLVVKSAPGAPVNLPNRVIPGTLIKSSGAYAYLVRFDVPQDLQNQLGLDISLVQVKVAISGKPRTFTVHGKKVTASFLGLIACKGKQNSKATVYFKDHDTGQQKTETSTGTGKC